MRETLVRFDERRECIRILTQERNIITRLKWLEIVKPENVFKICEDTEGSVYYRVEIQNW